MALKTDEEKKQTVQRLHFVARAGKQKKKDRAEAS